MKNFVAISIVWITLIVIPIPVLGQSYIVTPLGNPDLGGAAINDSAMVCGYDFNLQQGFLWDNGNVIHIPNSTEGLDVNDFGKACGYTWVGVIKYSFIYENGVTTLISPLSGERCNANAINDNGLVTGRTTIGPDLQINHPYLYDGNTMIDLGTLGGPEGLGVDINNSGWIVGSSYTNNSAASRRPFIYKGSVLEQLPVPSGTVKGAASGINDSGMVCGSIYLDSLDEDRHAVKWDPLSNVSILPELPGDVESAAYAVSNYGEVVGTSRDTANYPTAVIWKDGSVINLNDEIDPGLGIYLTFAVDINNQGQILCWGSGNSGDFILTPIDTLEGFIVNDAGDDSDADLSDGECDVDLQQPGNQCTCRAAMEQANHDANASVITFDIPGSGVPVIAPQSPLPDINTPVTIDGSTQPNAGYVQIDGSAAGPTTHGLSISADNCEVRGLIINKFGGDGIKITGNTNTIVGNIIGTDKSSATGLGNGNNGISITNASDNIIGNPYADELNIIAGNQKNGIQVMGNNSTGNLIQSNYIGTDTSGTDGLGNGEAGIEIIDASAGNRIGIGIQQLRNMSNRGSLLNFGNVIARNNIAVKILNTNNSKIIGNIVGLFKSPFGNVLSKLGSAAEGLLITDSEGIDISECTIGGTGGDGIKIVGLQSKFNRIFKTYIGTDSSGTLGLGCDGNGVSIDSLAKGNSVGGCGDDSTVTVAGNGLNGILLRYAGLQQTVDTLLNNIRNVQIGVIQNINKEDSRAFIKIPNLLSGITINNSILTHIGEYPCPNTIAGNSGPGILIDGLQSALNQISTNLIGTTNQGDADVGNDGDGIRITGNANNNFIGGLSGNSANTISGNLQNGIAIISANNNKILGNIAGLFQNGSNPSVPLGNLGNGIYLKDSFRNFISKCLVSSNVGNGIQISGALSQFNKIVNVIIGSDSSAAAGLGNKKNGVEMTDMAGGNTIGGIGPDSSVTIVGSQEYAVKMTNLLSELNNKIMNAKIGIISNIGTENQQSFIKIPNHLGGINIQNSTKILVGNILAKNMIAGNNGPGILLEGLSTSLNTLVANMIGTDSTGTPNLGNHGAALRLVNGANNNNIGGDNAGESNICVSSASGFGVELSNTYNNKITQLLSGVFGDGQTLQVLSNNIGMLLNNCTGTLIKRSLFSGNSSDGIKITGTGSIGISISDSRVGTNFGGDVSYGNGGNGITMAKACSVDFSGAQATIINGNGGYGLYGSGVSNINAGRIYAGVDAQANVNAGYKNGKGAIRFDASSGVSIGAGGQFKNIVAGYDSSAITMKNSTGSIENNLITTSNVGVKANLDTLTNILGNSLIIQRNIINDCQRAIQVNDASAIYIAGNLIKGNLGIGSGIHMYNSSGQIEGNTITDDAGDAIYLEDQSDPTIYKNSIYANNGYGLRNADPSIVINAQSNWWGDASGPGGAGPGSGDEVSAGVNFQNWRIEPVSVAVLGGPDTTYQSANTTDTISASVLNWENPTDVIDIILSDSLGWLAGQTSFTVNLNDSLGSSFPIIISIPAGTPGNTINRISIDAVSQINSNHSDTDDFFVITYIPELSRIVLYPDSAEINVNDSLHFVAVGFDQSGQPINFAQQWSAAYGGVSNDGLYFAPAASVTDTVTVADPVSHLSERAIVVVNDPTKIEDEEPILLRQYELSQNFPNPFNPSTTIRFALPEPGNVRLEVYNILGEKVVTLVNGRVRAGNHEATFNAGALATGLYIYRIQMNRFIDVKKMMLIK